VSEHQVVDITIIGGGPVGLAAAYYGGHRDASVRIIESLGQLGGQVAAVYPEKHVYDVAGHPKVQGQALVDLCVEQGLQFGAEVHLGREVKDLQRVGANGEEILVVTTHEGDSFPTRALIVTAGHGAFEPRKLEIEGIDSWEGKGLHYFVRRKEVFRDKTCVIVGGGDSALDWTLGLQDTANKPITLVHRRDRFRALETSVKEARELEERGNVRICNPAEVRGVRGDGSIQAVTLENTTTGETFEVECDALIMLLGFHSHLGSIADWGLDLHGKRQILVQPSSMETSIPGVYAAGDVAGYDGKITLISVGFGEAAIAANQAIAKIRGERIQPKYSTD
jgi:ferredoxin/flavodoxin---NADP+ reductase